MAKITMIETAFGATSYLQPKPYFKGRVYDVEDELALSFIDQGVATIFEDYDPAEYEIQSPPPALQTKIITPSAKRHRGRPRKTSDALQSKNN